MDITKTLYDISETFEPHLDSDGVWRIDPGCAILENVICYVSDRTAYWFARRAWGSSVELYHKY